MKFLRLSCFSFALVAASSLVHAQNADEARLRPAWEALDKNKDGKVTLDEPHPFLAAVMKGSDLDGDGSISLAEYVDFDLDPGGAGRQPLSANVKLSADIAYAGTSDPRQRLDIYLPKRPNVHGPLPVVAYIHGGAWMTGSKIMARSQVMALVESGRYAAVSIGYRLSWQDAWPSQINDVKAAIRWIRAHAREYGFDPERICALGPSAGGHLAAKLGLTNDLAGIGSGLGPNLTESSAVQCVIDEFGPTDLQGASGAWPLGGPSPLDLLLGGKAAENQEVARSASPILDVTAKAPPFLIVHGTKDPLVKYQDSVQLDAALRKVGVPVLFQTIEGGGHGDFGAASPALAERIRLFLEWVFYDPKIDVPTDPLKR